MKKREIEFLSLAELIEIHNNQIELYGGEYGIRDISLLSSALSIPLASFNGRYLHDGIFNMAAAYIYHICQNHPFVDGNKRVALVAGLLFLDFNGVEILDPHEELYTMMMKVASGSGDKKYIAGVLKKLAAG